MFFFLSVVFSALEQQEFTVAVYLLQLNMIFRNIFMYAHSSALKYTQNV